MKRAIIAICVTGLLSGCASQGTINTLNNATNNCAVGNLQACQDIPYIQHKADEEVNASIGLILLIPLAIMLGAR